MINNRLIKLININKQSIALYNEKNVQLSYQKWHNFLPFIKPYYAIKSLSHPFILNTLSNFDIGYDVASIKEIKKIINYNKPIIYSHTIKEPKDIKYTFKKNINNLVVDSINELHKVKKYNKNANIIWRIKSYEKNSIIKFNNKFGANFNETEYVLKNYSFIHGISYHVGSKCKDMISHFKTLDLIINNFLNKKNNIKLIDIGGGFTNEKDIIYLKNKCKHQFNFLLSKNIELIAEPGRYFSRTSIDLYTKIYGIKYDNNTNIYHLFINDSIYNSFSGKKYDYQIFKPIPLYQNNKNVKCIIWGNTCDGDDIIIDNLLLPKPAINDILLWENMGSYSLSSSTNGFNGFKMAKVYKNKIDN